LNSNKNTTQDLFDRTDSIKWS